MKLSGIESPSSKLGQRRGLGNIDLRNVKGILSTDQSISSPRKRSIDKTDVFIVGEICKEEKGEVSNTTIQAMRQVSEKQLQRQEDLPRFGHKKTHSEIVLSDPKKAEGELKARNNVGTPEAEMISEQSAPHADIVVPETANQ